MVNFPINLRCYVLLGCRVINVILAINIGDSAFFDIAALVRQFGGLRHHQQTESIHWPPQTKILATPLRQQVTNTGVFLFVIVLRYFCHKGMPVRHVRFKCVFRPISHWRTQLNEARCQAAGL